MSDETLPPTPSDRLLASGKKDKNDERGKSQVEPVVKNRDFLEWMEGLFYAEPEPAHFPEWIEVNPVWGKEHESLGKAIYRKDWAAGKEGGKPSREKIASIANTIFLRCQQTTDVKRVRTVFGIHAWHMTTDSDPYERYLLEFFPGPTHRGDAPNGEDDPKTMQEKFAEQVLSHGQKMFELHGGATEGLLDRMDRIVVRQEAKIEKQDERIEKLLEIVERALSLDAERAERREWAKLKVEAARKGLDFGMSVVPMLLNGIIGKNLLPGKETAESMTLKKYFEPQEKGGLLNQEQKDTIFGVYGEGPDFECIKAGILNFEQAKILFTVAYGQAPLEELDKLLPGESYQITLEQVSQLQSKAGLGMGDIAPLHMIFENRKNARAKQQTQS